MRIYIESAEDERDIVVYPEEVKYSELSSFDIPDDMKPSEKSTTIRRRAKLLPEGSEELVLPVILNSRLGKGLHYNAEKHTFIGSVELARKAVDWYNKPCKYNKGYYIEADTVPVEDTMQLQIKAIYDVRGDD